MRQCDCKCVCYNDIDDFNIKCMSCKNFCNENDNSFSEQAKTMENRVTELEAKVKRLERELGLK